MQTAVRYYSRSGNTKALAEAIAKGAGCAAVSVDKDEAQLREKAEVLFIGGALYAYGLDRHLKDYLAALDPQTVGCAAVFSTSRISRHALELIKKALENKGVPVAEEVCYFRGRPDVQQLKEAEEFARRQLTAAQD